MPRSGKARKKWWGQVLSRLSWTCLKILFGLALLSMCQVGCLRFLNPPITAPMIWGWSREILGIGTYHWPAYTWRSLGDISPHLVKAVIAAEDQRFYRHHGFDFIELNDAFQDLVHSGRVRGASTITMQGARSLFLWPRRSLLRKSLEAYYTLLMEVFWSKDRILEVYLNSVDWGDGIVGAEAASRRYFRRTSREVTREQAAALAAILPSPHRWSPLRPNRRVREKMKRILRDMESVPLGCGGPSGGWCRTLEKPPYAQAAFRSPPVILVSSRPSVCRYAW